MTVAAAPLSFRVRRFRDEALKLPAFLRRDLLVAISYRAIFVGDILSLVMQALLFAYIGKLVDTSTMPSYNGEQASYVAFATIGIAVGAFTQLGLGRAALAIRNEQLVGTLEPMLTTPTEVETIQVGSVMFDLVYVPVRTAVFFALMMLFYGLTYDWSGALPSLVILLLLIPSVWGLGIVGAAAVMTFRRGTGTVGLAGMFIALASGAYFPLTLLPEWLQSIMRATPMAIALQRIRDALIGGTGWSNIGVAAAILIGWAACSLAIGLLAFRHAVRRERRLGTLGLY
jgi:ABC-2 type transport system permease protein